MCHHKSPNSLPVILTTVQRQCYHSEPDTREDTTDGPGQRIGGCLRCPNLERTRILIARKKEAILSKNTEAECNKSHVEKPKCKSGLGSDGEGPGFLTQAV